LDADAVASSVSSEAGSATSPRALRSCFFGNWGGGTGNRAPSGATDRCQCNWKAAGPSGPVVDQAVRTHRSGSVGATSPREHRARQRWQHHWLATDSSVEQSPEVESLAMSCWLRVRAEPTEMTGDNGVRAVSAVAPGLRSCLRIGAVPGLTLEMLPGREKLRRVGAIGKGFRAGNMANPMAGCRVQQTCAASRGVNRRSREKRHGRTMR
jgi:hypothetical protein